MIYEVILKHTGNKGAYKFLLEEHGVPFRDTCYLRHSEIYDALKNSDKEWAYAFFIPGVGRYYFKSEAAAIEFKLRFG